MNPTQREHEEHAAAIAALMNELTDDPSFRLDVEQGDIREAVEAYLGPVQLVKAVETAKRELERLRKLQIAVLPITDPSYPESLKHIHSPPLMLFYRGSSLSSLTVATSVAVVGSRKADQPGIETARSMSRAIAEAGGTVVSGLAFGIDAAAHRGALDSKQSASTIAVLGNGLAAGIYPSAHARLAQEIIAAGGLILSQFHPDAKPYPSNFLDRNRVIAGLSQATIIIQAATRSGALSTARHAMEEGRDVLVVPGDIRDPLYGGSNELLKQGAHLVTSTADVFAHLPALVHRARRAPEALGEVHEKILEDLAGGPRHVDEIRPSAMEYSQYLSLIFELEEAGLIVRMPGNRLMRAREI